MAATLGFDRIRSILIGTMRGLPDVRTGLHRVYEVTDAALAAFAVFFMQAPSFLAHQREMQERKGQNNASSLFVVEEIPSDPQLRNLLDPVPPECLAPAFWQIFEHLQRGDHLAGYQGHLGQWLVALDGSHYFSSQKIHCERCTTRVVDGETYYAHSLVAPVLIAPGQERVIALEPEFVQPQDGHDKQDCELRAAERLLARLVQHFAPGSLTLLGDDLYCHQPFCEIVLAHQCHFVFTCLPKSHAALYEEVALLNKVNGVTEVTESCWLNGRQQVWQYRSACRVPLRADTKPLYVNWCEVTITDAISGAQIYHNAWATDHPLETGALHRFVVAARTRWKSENENNNVLKNYGYHLEHNFGHGKQYLTMTLVMLNVLAFLTHTVLDLTDARYRRVRLQLATRQTFFNDLRALTRYFFFATWHDLISFMFTQLEIDPNAPDPPRYRRPKRR